MSKILPNFAADLKTMNILNTISGWFKRDRKNTQELPFYGGFFGGLITRKPFARLLFANICDILGSLANDVEWVRKEGTDTLRFSFFVQFYKRNARRVLHLLWQQGFAIIGTDGQRFSLLKQNEYTTYTDQNGNVVYKPIEQGIEIYVMESETFAVYGVSDEQMCKPALDYADTILNASTTIASRLGAFIVATPKSPSGASVGAFFGEDEQKDLEEKISKAYGAKDNQSQILILPNEMDFKTMSLASLDLKTNEKLVSAVCMICDRIGVPANQVALIDTHSNKALANGSELREGDFNKYQSFERLLDYTFVHMAEAYGIGLDYTIYNKPQRTAQNA